MIRDLFFIRQLEKLKNHDWLRYFVVGYITCRVYEEMLEALKYSSNTNEK